MHIKTNLARDKSSKLKNDCLGLLCFGKKYNQVVIGGSSVSKEFLALPEMA